MFNIPITLVYRHADAVQSLPASVPIDSIVTIKPIDILADISVESRSTTDLVPRTTIRLDDGRVLVVSDPAGILYAYLDAYRSYDEFYSRISCVTPPDRSGPILTLIQGGKCDTSQASTPA